MEIKRKVILRCIAGEYLLIPVENTVDEYNGMFSVTETGALIFKALLDGKDEAQTADLLCEEYDVSREQAMDDVSAFIETLASYGIV